MSCVTRGGNMMDNRTFPSCSCWFLWPSSLFFRMVEFIHKVADPFPSLYHKVDIFLVFCFHFICLTNTVKFQRLCCPIAVSECGCWHLAYQQQCPLVVPDTASCFICVYFSLFQHSQHVLFSDFSVKGLPHPAHS